MYEDVDAQCGLYWAVRAVRTAPAPTHCCNWPLRGWLYQGKPRKKPKQAQAPSHHDHTAMLP